VRGKGERKPVKAIRHAAETSAREKGLEKSFRLQKSIIWYLYIYRDE
jgi:hypothetical protein